MPPFIDIAVRTLIVFLCLVIGLRIFGKKELAQLSVTDLVLILLIANSVQNAMVGSDVSLLGGLVAALTLLTVNFILKNVFYKSKRISELFQGDPLMLIYHGNPIIEHMARARISMDELEASVREHGVENVKNVDLAVLEVDGNISILSNDFKHHTVKRRRAHKVVSKEE